MKSNENGCDDTGRRNDYKREERFRNFVRKSNMVHGPKYDYSGFDYINNKTKSIIICKRHGQFSQTPHDHLSGCGCPSCGRIWAARAISNDIESFIERSRIIHKNKYDYSHSVYLGTNKSISIICPNHGTFWQTAANHLSGKGCGKCKGEAASKRKTKTFESFLHLATQLHKNYYGYDEADYKDRNTKMKIRCPKHGMFFQSPHDHLGNHGCPNCGHERRANQSVSSTSGKEKEFLDTINIREDCRGYSIRKYTVDGIDLETRTVYEFLGDYWHGNPDTFDVSALNESANSTFGALFDYTFYRFDKIKELGYSVKYVWEHDWNEYRAGRLQEIPLKTY